MAINPLNLTPQASELQNRSSDRVAPETKSDASSSQAPVTTPAKQQDTVKLSGAAQSIQSAERKLADTPEVDQQKVDRLKAAIESGEYKADTQRTASGMMNFEQLFS